MKQINNPIQAGPAPWWFSLVLALPRGRHRILGYLDKRGFLNRIATFPFHNRMVALPLHMVNETADLSKYQHRRICTFASLCDRHLGRFDFFDCGASVGLFSAQFAEISSQVEKLVAIEPNSYSFSVLEFNLRSARAMAVECLHAAIADFEGRGRLVAPDYDSGAEARYLIEDPAGDTNVITLARILDSGTQPRAAIKIDIEGYELPVLQSAADQIRKLNRVLLFVEIHEAVLRRVGISDVDLLRSIEAIRPFSWVSAHDGKPVDSRHPVLPQMNLSRQCDLIGLGLEA